MPASSPRETDPPTDLPQLNAKPCGVYPKKQALPARREPVFAARAVADSGAGTSKKTAPLPCRLCRRPALLRRRRRKYFPPAPWFGLRFGFRRLLRFFTAFIFVSHGSKHDTKIPSRKGSSRRRVCLCARALTTPPHLYKVPCIASTRMLLVPAASNLLLCCSFLLHGGIDGKSSLRVRNLSLRDHRRLWRRLQNFKYRNSTSWSYA